ncbi:MAG: hypothetical protein ABSG43_01480 [Solirubrobacteraceae bacterium]
MAMALQATTTTLRQAAVERLGADTFESYLAELEVVEASPERVVLRVGPTLAREASRRCGQALAGVCRQLFGPRRVLLAGDGESFELGENTVRCVQTLEPRTPAKPRRAGRGRRRVRQRSGPCGQPGIKARLAAQRSFRVRFAIAASLPKVASQAFGRHSPDEPLRYVGRWGRAYGERTLTAFHLRLLAGILRLAQAGCLTEQGVFCSINLLLLAAFPPILKHILVRTAEEPERLRPLAEIMQRGEDGRWQPTSKLARGGGASILIALNEWVLEALDAPTSEAGTTFALLDSGPFLAVGSRRLFSWQQACTAPPVNPKAPLPDGVPRPPSNTVYKQIDLNHVSVRDFGRHGCDLDRICDDIREDFRGEHGLAQIDRRIHSVHPVWSGGVLSLWVCWRTARELPHRGELPRRLAARKRWQNRRHEAARTRGQRNRQDAAHAGETSTARTARSERGVPKIVALARSQTASGDDGDG